MSETSRVTLTEFLLARIAEDEATARAEDERRTAWSREFAGKASIVITEWDVGPGNPARVLAECEAKRRIVEEAVHQLQHPHRVLDVTAWFFLRCLAWPYADHPDFDTHWTT